jgi:phage shock protein PspC (stress-responsive transcriptional regulator)
MNKTIIINISGIIFHIEEDAYEKLKSYMTEVKSYFIKSEDNFEIVSDIENRIAELFSEIILVEEKQVIVMNDVDRIIRTMGQAKDFESAMNEEIEEEVDETSIPKNIKKRLYRNPDDKIAAGICSGIAAYFDVDPLWIRLALTLSIVFFGTGIFLYLILWVIMPEAITRTEKLAMRGEAPTIESIRKSIEEEMAGMKRNFNNASGEIRNIGNNSALRGFISSVFVFANKAFSLFTKLIVKAVGILIMFVSGAFFIALTVTILTLFGVVDGQISADIPMFMLRTDHQNVMYFAWYFVLIIPIIVVFMVGIRILFNTNPFNKISGWSMLSIWILSLFVGGFYTIDTLSNFKEEGRLQQTVVLQNSTAKKYYLISDNDEKYNYYDTLKTNEFGLKDKMVLKSQEHNFGFDNVSIKIEKSLTNELRLVTTYEGRGKTETEAIKSAESIVYLFEQNDSVLVFPRFFKLKNNSNWRAQDVELTLYVPFNTELIIQERVDHLIHNIYSGECERDEYDRIKWVMGKDGMQCTKKIVEQ